MANEGKTLWRWARAVTLLAVIAMWSGTALASWTFTNLGTLGGSSSTAYAINSSGQVAGTADPEQASYVSALWSNGAWADLGAGSGSTAYGINGTGQVVGSFAGTDGVHAFLWSSGAGLQDLGVPWNGVSSYAKAINSSGQVAGYVYTDATTYHAALWSNGAWQNLDDGTTVAHGRTSAINDSGQVVGSATFGTDTVSHATLWSEGSAKNLDAALTGITVTSSAATGINNSGQVAGYFGTQVQTGTNKKGQPIYSTAQHAFLWSNDTIQDLGVMEGGSNSFAYGINGSGQVVGAASTSAGPSVNAALWSDGAVTDLTGFMDPGWSSTFAYAITDDGRIAGTGQYNNQSTGFTLTQNLWVTAFSVPATSSSLTVPITEFTATDPTGIGGYLVTESATAPSATADGWSTTPPTGYTFSAAGAKTLYAWAKDTADNVSFGVKRDVTIAQAATVTLANLAATYDGTAKGATATTNPAGLDVSITYNGSSIPPTAAGSYAVAATVTSVGYTGSASGTLTIAKATPTLAWGNPADIVYGTALDATQLNVVPSVPGTVAYSPASGTILNVGSAQLLTATVTPSDSANYTTATATVAINVNPAPLGNNRHIFINVANDSGVKYDMDGAKYGGPANTYYIKADAGGLNADWIAPLATDSSKPATVVPTAEPTASGTLYFIDAGGRGFSDDIIMMLSVKGPIPENFSVNIKSSGYTWTPATPGVYNPSKPTTAATGLLGTATTPLADGSLNGLPVQGTNMAYQPGAVDETFTKADLMYGPQVYKPGPGTLGVWSLPLYPGQILTDPSSAEYVMFIDLKAGAMRDATLTDNGAVRVDYTFNNLRGDASFNTYAWVTASNQGEGISFTNPSSTNGYTVSYTGPTVADVTYSASGPYKAGSEVTVTAAFSKYLADSPAPTITLGGAENITAPMTKVDASHYAYGYVAGSGNGEVTVSLAGTDAAGNALSLTPATGAVFTLDNTAPIVNAATPADGTVDVPIDSRIAFTFSEAVDPASVTSEAFLVNGITGTVSYDPASKTATFTPSAPLANSTVYAVTVTGAIKDPAGNPLTPLSFSFTTAAPPDTNAPTAALTYAPAGPYKAGTVVTITATFSEAMADAPAPTLTLSGADTVTAAVMTKTDATHYTYSYTAGSGNGEVTAAPGGGTDLAGNPVVTTATAGTTFTLDNTPPAVADATPADGATDVRIDSQVLVHFSEPMDPSTVTSGTVVLGGVASSVTYDPSTRVATITPNAPLTNSTAYTVSVAGGAKDLAGNATTPVSFSFTTAAPPDTTPPTAAVSYAPAGPYVKGTPVTITATFSEAMRTSAAPKITLSGVESVTADMTRVDVNHYTYSYTAGAGIGNVTVALSAGTDLAGNPVVSTPTEGGSFALAYPAGNLTGGDTVTMADALKVLRSVAGLYAATPEESRRADVAPLVDGKPAPDGKIDIGDAVVILRKVVGLENW